jgi:hypothetical protein
VIWYDEKSQIIPSSIHYTSQKSYNITTCTISFFTLYSLSPLSYFLIPVHIKTYYFTTFSLHSFLIFSFMLICFRAFEEPPRRALLYWNKHFRTDELLGAWLFLFGTVPAVPYALVYFIIDPSFTYIGDPILLFS